MAEHSLAWPSSPPFAHSRSHSHATSWLDEHDENDASSPAKPLSGPGTSRQTPGQRLLLRNARLKASAVPTRKVTPKSTSTNTSSAIVSVSDAENYSPSGKRVSSVKVEKRRSSGILQEIGNSAGGTLTRSRKGRPRISSAKLFAMPTEVNNYDGVYADDPWSPPPPAKGTIRAKSAKSRTKAKPARRSMSGEARMYIDHLEAELASAQVQLQAINSPSVTRKQTHKMRDLTHETKQLQEELDEWEAKYDSRIQEVLDEHLELEAGLKAHIKKLEEDAEEARYRAQELQIEVDAANQGLEVAEAANVQLEKRLEIMSEILASSPSKLDLHAVTPGMAKKDRRPKSMLPRFPTASSLVASPDKEYRTYPTSPLLNFTDSRQAALEALEGSVSGADLTSDAESVFSEAPTNGGNSMTSLEEHGEVPNFNPWTLQALQSAKQRPHRRMRRFGPGSHGPKALILPSTSGFELQPATAPPLERSETMPAFGFALDEGDEAEDEDSPSAAVARRRASTTADEDTFARLASSPFLQLPSRTEMDAREIGDRLAESEDVSRLSLGPPGVMGLPMSGRTERATQDFSSLGSKAGRDLMAELCAVDSHESVASSPEPSAEGEEAVEEVEEGDVTMLVYRNEVEEGVDMHSLLSTDDAEATSSALLSAHARQTRSRSHSRNRSTSTTGLSYFDRLRNLFGDLWRSPVALARHLVQTASERLTIPAPLRSVQWWLVGVLLGPMARRRLLMSGACSNACDLEQQPLLQSYTPAAEVDGLVYGTMYHTPPHSPARSVSLVAGKGKKRASVSPASSSSVVGDRKCKHHDHWSKHSPWMWLKFSITLAFAVGVAFKDGPASLLDSSACWCRKKEKERRREVSEGA